MKRVAVRIALAVLVVLALVFAWASVDRCEGWQPAPGGLTSIARAAGSLSVGAARVAFELPYPVTVGGYGPWHHEANASASALFARATIVDVGGQRFGLVSLETLLVSESLVTSIREGRDFQVWVVATHTHTGPGNFDRRPAAELAALGSWRAEVEGALVKSAKAALDAASASLKPATMSLAQSSLDITRARTGDDVDARLTVAQFRSATDADTLVAQWVFLAAHPTLIARNSESLDGDYPNRVATSLENQSESIVTVLQTAGANASANGSVDEFAGSLRDRVQALAVGATQGSVSLGTATSDVILGHPDGSRLGPAIVRPIIENTLCRESTPHAEVDALRLGPLKLIAVPAEVSLGSAKVIEQQSGASLVVSLANGYAGYLEPERRVLDGAGESKLQYFGPELLEHVSEAARTAGIAAGFVQQE